MKKIMNNTIEIAPDFLLRQLGWAMRYCANRSTYAVSDCTDMAQFIHRNRDRFDPGKVKFLARDLLCEANDRLGWKHNVHIKSNDNHSVRHSAYHLIAEHLEKHPEMRFCNFEWCVDCINGSFETTRREEPLREHYGGVATLHDMDIETVCIAADIIDPDKHYRVTTLYNGHEETKECIKSIFAEQIYDDEKHMTLDYKYSEVYRIIDRPHAWVAPEYITKIEKI